MSTPAVRFGEEVRRLRVRSGLTQRELARRCELWQPRISAMESGRVTAHWPEVLKLAQVFGVPLQAFLTGVDRPGTEPSDLLIELHGLGAIDLVTGAGAIPGAARHPEEIVARALIGTNPDPRIIEAIPAILAWNPWHEPLLRAFARLVDPRVERRLAWLADVTMTLHRLEPLPRPIVASSVLEEYVQGTPTPTEVDGLGHPVTSGFSPVHRRWKVTYATTLQEFRQRLLTLDRLRQPEEERNARTDS